MAAMDSAKLQNMCNAINNFSNDYVTKFTNSVKEITNVFNTNWVSNSSRELVKEISDCLDSLAQEITHTFSVKNDEISKAVKNFAMIEQESIYYPGFSFAKPSSAITLNNALPNGKTGVADNANLDTINAPMQNMVASINDILDGILRTVTAADAFSDAEQQALARSIQNIRTAFNNEMDELKKSLETRMNEEIETRNKLNAANAGLLS